MDAKTIRERVVTGQDAHGLRVSPCRLPITYSRISSGRELYPSDSWYNQL